MIFAKVHFSKIKQSDFAVANNTNKKSTSQGAF